MGRCEGGAAVEREAGDAASRVHRVDAAPAVRPRKPSPGRPWPAVRRHYDRLPAVLRNDGLHAAATKERWPPLRIGGLNTGPVAARKYGPKGLQERRKVERREAPFSDRKEEGDAFARCLGRPRRPLRELRTLPRFPALRSPRGSAELDCDEGSPGADINNTGDESCLFLARSGQARRALFGAKRASPPRAVRRESGAV